MYSVREGPFVKCSEHNNYPLPPLAFFLHLLRGTKFTELIATAEARSRAAEILNEEAEARAHAFHTQLVDGCFTQVQDRGTEAR